MASSKSPLSFVPSVFAINLLCDRQGAPADVSAQALEEIAERHFEFPEKSEETNERTLFFTNQDPSRIGRERSQPHLHERVQSVAALEHCLYCRGQLFQRSVGAIEASRHHEASAKEGASCIGESKGADGGPQGINAYNVEMERWPERPGGPMKWTPKFGPEVKVV